MDYLARIKGLLLDPRAEWQRIAAEPGDAMRPFTQYAVPVSALPVLAGFIGGLLFWGLIGRHVGFFGHLFASLLAYALGLAGVFILAKLVGFLAPRFGGTADEASAMKLAAYAPTASWLAGISALIPPLGFLAILGLYSLYIFWVGVPVLVRVPEERRLMFTLALIGCAIVVNILLAGLVAIIL
jgi:hypothetical protein